MSTTTPITGTDFVMVPVTDLPRAEQFYGETLGLPRGGKWGEVGTEFETGSLTIAVADVAKLGGGEYAKGSGAIALRVDDVAAARSLLEERGVTFHTQFDSGVCHQAIFSDP